MKEKMKKECKNHPPFRQIGPFTWQCPECGWYVSMALDKVVIEEVK